MPQTACSVRQTVVDGIEVVRLASPAGNAEVALAPSIGNMAYEMKVNGKPVLWFPFSSPAELRDNPALCAIPFLGPWANRLDGMEYWANGRKYILNPGLGNLRLDHNRNPIHGLLNFTPLWEVAACGADDRTAWVTSRLEFWKYPDLMAQFPFAHRLAMTYRLSGTSLEVETAIENLCAEPMPVAVGFHPYLRIDDAPRDQWRVHLAARDHLELNPLLIPTGARKPLEFAGVQPLAGLSLDDVFGDLVRDADGRARFWVEGNRQRVTLTYGEKFRIAVAYSPQDRDFICFEPMAAVTNAFNLAHAGLYPDLETIPPGAVWRESFWIEAQGW